MGEWIGVDLDGTLAKSNRGSSAIGKPVAAMVDRVKGVLDSGTEVRIFTARAGSPGGSKAVRKWLDENGLDRCGVTNKKDADMKELWDDRARRVRRDSGDFCGGCGTAKFALDHSKESGVTDC